MEKILRDTLKGGRFSAVTPVNSRRMSAVKSTGNKTTERRLRLALARARINGWTIHPVGLVGRPDFYFHEKRLAIFVDGCFWHGCEKCGHIPNINNQYWKTKIVRNRERDLAKTQALMNLGITVLRFWEHELRSELPSCVARIKRYLFAKSR